MSRNRRDAQRRGIWAEEIAAWWLRLRGYRILARRFRCAAGEIDLVARRGGTLVFVEVKYRADHGDAAYAITPRQQQRIARAAAVFAAQSAAADLRFDAVLMAPWRRPRHLTDAWRPESP